MRNINTSDIKFLKKLQEELNGRPRTGASGPELSNPQDLTRLLILVSSVDWSGTGHVGTVQMAISRAEEYYAEQSTIRSLENTYVPTKHPHRVDTVKITDACVRVTFAVDVPVTRIADVMSSKRHVALNYDIQADCIYQS